MWVTWPRKMCVVRQCICAMNFLPHVEIIIIMYSFPRNILIIEITYYYIFHRYMIDFRSLKAVSPMNTFSVRRLGTPAVHSKQTNQSNVADIGYTSWKWYQSKDCVIWQPASANVSNNNTQIHHTSNSNCKTFVVRIFSKFLFSIFTINI